MKAQRNIQQAKKYDKNPSVQNKQTNKKGSGGDRESTWKIIQNTDSKDESKSWKRMDLQISRLVTQTEKMQDMLNKDLEEIKRSQSITYNAITKIKSTLEGTNSRINEAKERISEVESKMVEINEAWGEGGRELKAMRKTTETSGTMSNPIIRIVGVPEEEAKRKHMR